ncbi:MAG: hypothetical protein KC621_26705, partial [Myxococcales bacterium]|nr:hypothetical protein [Myxococcales bacterium]
MIAVCPACENRYRIRRQLDHRGARITCPACLKEFVVRPDDVEATGELSARTLEAEAIRSIEQHVELPGISLIGDLPSEEDLEWKEAPKREPPPPPPYFPPARAVEDVPLDEYSDPEIVLHSRSMERPSLGSGDSSGRMRAVVDSSILARRLLEEERVIPADRFVKPSRGGPVLWMSIGAGFVLAVVACAGVGVGAAALVSPSAS